MHIHCLHSQYNQICTAHKIHKKDITKNTEVSSQIRKSILLIVHKTKAITHKGEIKACFCLLNIVLQGRNIKYSGTGLFKF